MRYIITDTAKRRGVRYVAAYRDGTHEGRHTRPGIKRYPYGKTVGFWKLKRGAG